MAREARQPHATAIDVELWRVTKAARIIVCRQREVHRGDGHWDDHLGTELRVAHNDQIYLTELHRDPNVLRARVAELRGLLEATGWTTAEQ